MGQTEGIVAKAIIIKKSYLAARNAASNLGEWTAGNKNLTQAVTDTAISTGGDLIKDSADGFGQKLLYNTTMEGGKTVFQGWVDGKSAEEIRDETLKKMEKGFNDTINEGVNSAVFGDGVFSQVLTEIDNWEANAGQPCGPARNSVPNAGTGSRIKEPQFVGSAESPEKDALSCSRKRSAMGVKV